MAEAADEAAAASAGAVDEEAVVAAAAVGVAAGIVTAEIAGAVVEAIAAGNGAKQLRNLDRLLGEPAVGGPPFFLKFVRAAFIFQGT